MKAPILPFVAASLIFAGCASQPVPTQEKHAEMTPDRALVLLQEGNARFASGKSIRRDFSAERQATSGSQHPFACVVICADSRTSAELIFDQGLGGIFNARLAGNVIDDDVLASLEYGTEVAGTKLIAVIGHTGCGAVKAACDDEKLGHVTGLLAHIEPAVKMTTTPSGEARSSKNTAFVNRVVENNVRVGMAAIREQSPILKELIDSGKVGLVGGVYDLETGQVHFLK